MYGEAFNKKIKNSIGDGGLDFLRLLKKESTKPDSVASTGPYLAQVLRVEVVTPENDETSLAAELKNNYAYMSRFAKQVPPNPFAKKRWVIVYGRITNEFVSQPPIHNFLPTPAQIGSLSDIGDDALSDNIIRAHDRFVSQTPTSDTPSVGSFVWVDFLDKRGGQLKHPIYIKPLLPSDPAQGAPTVNKECPKAVHNKVPATGGKIKNTPNNPQAIKRIPGSTSSVPMKPYRMHGYRWQDFTHHNKEWQKNRFAPNKQFGNNMQGLVAAAEVIHMYFKAVFPKSNIRIIHGHAATKRTSPTSKHNFGIAMDVRVKMNGKVLAIPRVWAALVKLVAAKKLPDGAIGYYQQSKDNKVVTDGTNIEPATGGGNNPHYDFRTETHDGLPASRSRIKWNWTSIEDKKGKPATKTKYKSFSAKKILAWTGGVKNLYPPHCQQALADYTIATGTPSVPLTLPTWKEVVDKRALLKAQNQPLAKATVTPSLATPAALQTATATPTPAPPTKSTAPRPSKGKIQT